MWYPTKHLKSGVGLGDLWKIKQVSMMSGQKQVHETYEINEVGLEPGAGLRSGLLGIVETAGGVVADSRGVRGAVTLSTGLDPDDLAIGVAACQFAARMIIE